MSLQNVVIPENLRELLTDFTMNYLHAEPPDPVEFGVLYFTKQKDKAEEKKYISYVKENYEIGPCKTIKRRKAVFSRIDETINTESQSRVSYVMTGVEKNRIKGRLKREFIFNAAEDETLDEIIENFQKEIYCPDHIVIKEGEPNDSFYVVEEGDFEASVKVGKERREVAIFHGEGAFGETALLYSTPGEFTVKAITRGVLWTIDRGTYRRIAVNAAIRRREENLNLISSVPILKGLTQEERLALADALVIKEYKKKERILVQGGRPRGMYFVLRGSCEVKSMSDELLTEVAVGHVGEGEYIGELALVSYRPSQHTVYTRETTKLAFLDVEAFERMFGPCVDIMKRDVDGYNGQMKRLFGDEANLTDIRGSITIPNVRKQ